MSLVTLKGAEISYGETRILHDADIIIHKGERIALVGRNGAGKSTLLKVLAGDTKLDDGIRRVDEHAQLAYLHQAVPEETEKTVYQIVADGLGEMGLNLATYNALATSADPTNKDLQRMADLETKISQADGWNLEPKITRILDELQLPGTQTMGSCSGGLRRRAMLGQALVSQPDILLLDEPTNHMDIESITYLQEILLSLDTTVVVVTHDRQLIDKVATRILEIDRGQVTSFPGSYQTYLNNKQKAIEEEETDNRKFDKVLAQEEAWIREGIKARRTRNEGRVRRLESLRRERNARLDKKGNVNIQVEEAKRSGNLVAKLENVSFSYDTPLIKNFSTLIRRQDRIGIIGANGTGKSTLIKLILGEIQPQTGRIELGTGLKIAYFDQQRQALDTSKTVRENISHGSDHVEINGKRKHIVGYLNDFLFPSHYSNLPVAQLSGGEKNRLLMAKLFTQPANMLVLDEPTNDLDIETLELLEEMLAEFKGTILLVSHDRAFLDAVATSTIVIGDAGNLNEYVGGYSDWQRQTLDLKRQFDSSNETTNQQSNADKSNSNANSAKTKKLSYKDQRELDRLPDKIEKLEAELAALQNTISDPNFYQGAETEVKQTLQALEELSSTIEQSYARWESLTEMSSG